MTFVPTSPQSGAMYYRLQSLIAANHQGLGPNNVGGNPYTPMVGAAFQVPASGSTTRTTTHPTARP
jgi:hypothetical protein